VFDLPNEITVNGVRAADRQFAVEDSSPDSIGPSEALDPPNEIVVDLARAEMTTERTTSDSGSASPQGPVGSRALVPCMPKSEPLHYVSYDNFVMDNSGLWIQIDGEETLVCAPFEVLARGRTPQGEDWSSQLRWRDDDGRPHELFVFDADLQRNFPQVCARLAASGLRIDAGPSRAFLLAYLNNMAIGRRVTTVSRTGWHVLRHGRVFVLPTAVIGPAGAEPVVFNGRADMRYGYDSQGALFSWQSGLAARVRGHRVPMLAMSAAFTGPLLILVDAEGGGLHFFGRSSIGKTTACQIAPASVWGSSLFVRSWRSTANGLEALAAVSNDTLLPLDELGVGEAADVAAAVYQLSASSGKNRAKSNGALQQPLSWRNIVLSTGELPIAAKLTGSGHRAQAGQLVRILDIPADAGCGYGVFDCAGPGDRPAELARAITVAARTSYGMAGPAFVHELIVHGEESVRRAVVEHVRDFERRNVPDGADGQVQRAAGRFALIGAAGELAIEYGILPWGPGEASEAAAHGLRVWMGHRGGVHADEVNQAVRQVRYFIEQYGESRFQQLDAGGGAPLIAKRGGWRRRDNDGVRTWWILPEVWRHEVCDGLDATATARILAARGFLKPDRQGKFARAERTPEGSMRVYVITEAIFSSDE
jgi:putative DNA primase/helicase